MLLVILKKNINQQMENAGTILTTLAIAHDDLIISTPIYT